MRVPTLAIAAVVLSAAGVTSLHASRMKRSSWPIPRSASPSRRAISRAISICGQARHQGEDRLDHRDRRDQLGDFGQLAFRAGFGELVRPRQRARQKLIAIATTIDRPFAQIVLRKEIAEAGGYDAKSPLEKRGALLKGRTIAVDSINSMIHAYVRLVAARSGINPDDIRVAPMAPASMLAAFQSKQIDGYAMSLPWPQKAVQDGEALLIASGRTASRAT